jgi:hypothetical protein
VTVVIKRSLSPNIVGSEFSQENELVPGALRAKIDRVVGGKLVAGTGTFTAKRALQIVREAVLCHQVGKVEEFRIVVVSQRSEEQVALATENLNRYRRSRIRMPRIIEGKQLDADDASLRAYQRVASHRTRCRKKLRGGN